MSDGFAVLFTRPLWLDEWHVALVARHDSLAQTLADLRAGSDNAPPLLHVITWLLRLVLGDAYTSPVLLRTLSFTLGVGAVALVCLTLRRRFSLGASALAALAVMGHTVVIEQVFQWRFYAPWLCLTALFAWALSLDGRAPSRRRDVVLAVGSILLCTIHWFGVIALGLMCLGTIAVGGRDRFAVRRMLPALAGIAVLAACIPFVIGQQRAIQGTSWMPAADLRQVLNLFRVLWLPAIPLVAALIIAAGMFFSKQRQSIRESVAAIRNDSGIAALAALALFPVAISIISFKQPALLPRYSIVTFLAWAPLVAIAVQSVGRIPRLLIAGGLGLVISGTVLNVQQQYLAYARGVATGRDALREACAAKLPVVFQQRHVIYAVTATQPACDVGMVALSPETLNRVFPRPQYEMAHNSISIEAEFAALHQRLYGFPRVVPEAMLLALPRFLVVESDPALPSPSAEQFVASVFPRHSVGRVGPGLILVTRN